MGSLLTRRWLAALLLLAVLAPEALPLGATRHRCACGMAVGCCCLLRAAMKAGDHCALLRQAPPCGMRPSQDRIAEILPRSDRASWTGIALRDGLRLRLAAAGAPPALDESPPDLPRPAPPVPPPRLVSWV
ncbi:MAG TPA: hypothetical protein VIC28_06200 [Thermoanaerobaculia bacterium]|jgi:hypothetical protein